MFINCPRLNTTEVEASNTEREITIVCRVIIQSQKWLQPMEKAQSSL
jgi:hypothetical protein